MVNERKALSVTQINLYIKEVISRDDILSDVLVKGELSNFKAHSSGHMYMSLKDESGVMRAVMFRSAAARLNFRPQNGMKVIAHGRVAVYERDGQYQLYIDDMQQEGQGDLYAAFEQLKKKLAAEGLFDPKHKKPLPKYPKKVGVVTAPTGAAIRDIINVLSRRFSYSDVVLYPVLVQGENSAASIVSAIEYFNATKLADVLIVGRGGGSIEDLWSFNEEVVARAIYDSRIPIVSAVGHEIDFTISDFVADLRAPTPSAAAELVVPSQIELNEKFNNVYRMLYRQAMQVIERGRMRVERCSDRPVFKNPVSKINDERQYLDSLSHMFETACKAALRTKRQELAEAAAKLNGLSPLGTLGRGYSLTKDDSGRVVRSVSQVNSGDMINVTVADGDFSARVV
ncbi:MAG: exodeoxyribonuclease VII large subunit [Clostridiales bacterium]|nr:exodeoxyribonuclease VII large subunit [Clostridiales bacterium]